MQTRILKYFVDNNLITIWERDSKVKSNTFTFAQLDN